jgi:hypothetical protein
MSQDILVTIFGRLFERDLATLESMRVSTREADGAIRTLDELAALGGLLGEDGHEPPVPDPVHVALLAAFPGYTAAVSGIARSLRDLQAEGMALPETTSMMRKRQVVDLSEHEVPAEALAPANLAATVARAGERVEAVGAKHVLLITPFGMVHVAGRTPEGTMAHWSNVEFSARTQIMRIEERLRASSEG